MVQKSDVMRLLTKLSAKSGVSLDGKGFRQMESLFEGISHRYLKDQLYDGASKPGPPTFNPRINNLDKIARYLSYHHFAHFVQETGEHPTLLSPQLEMMKGTYWSIVRCNSGHMDLLISEVKITEADGKIIVNLTSSTRAFSGYADLIGQCLYVTISDQQHKQIHIVLNVGNAVRPKLIQGVFCGVNSAGIPIAGRELFVRQEELPDIRRDTNRVSLESAKQQEIWRSVAEYFADYSRNNLKVRHVSRFDLTDLLLDQA